MREAFEWATSVMLESSFRTQHLSLCSLLILPSFCSPGTSRCTPGMLPWLSRSAGSSHGHVPASQKSLTPLAGAEHNPGEILDALLATVQSWWLPHFCRDRCSCNGNKSISQPDADGLMSPCQTGPWLRETLCPPLLVLVLNFPLLLHPQASGGSRPQAASMADA